MSKFNFSPIRREPGLAIVTNHLRKKFCIFHKKNYKLKIISRGYFELISWSFALVSLAIMPPGTDPHYSFCIFKMLGIKFCPGCGLGHSISYLLHGNIQASFSAHPLGLFAVIILLLRIFKLLQLHVFKNINNYARQ